MTRTRRAFILIVDRNRNSALILSKRLEALGYRTDYATTTESAIEALKNVQTIPDLILVEILDPTTQGMDFPRLVKERVPIAKSIPIVIHTTLGDKDNVRRAVECGFADYIVRPMEPEIFRDRIQKLVTRTPELSDETFNRPVGETGRLEIEIHVDVINEFGIKAYCNAHLPAGIQIGVCSPILRQLGFEPASMRIVATEPAANTANGTYMMTLSFVGLNGQEVRKLRHFAMQGTQKVS